MVYLIFFSHNYPELLPFFLGATIMTGTAVTSGIWTCISLGTWPWEHCLHHQKIKHLFSKISLKTFLLSCLGILNFLCWFVDENIYYLFTIKIQQSLAVTLPPVKLFLQQCYFELGPKKLKLSYFSHSYAIFSPQLR